MDFRSLAGKAKQLVDKRGGVGSLKEDAEELRDIAGSQGSLADKAKEAAEAVKDPGAAGPEAPGADRPSRAAEPQGQRERPAKEGREHHHVRRERPTR